MSTKLERQVTYRIDLHKQYLSDEIDRLTNQRKKMIQLIAPITLGLGYIVIHYFFKQRIKTLRTDFVALDTYQKKFKV